MNIAKILSLGAIQLSLAYGLNLLAAPTKLEIATFDYPPYMGENKISKEGVLCELTRAALKVSGEDVEIHSYPVKRAMSAITDNETFAYIGLISNFDDATRTNLQEFPLMNIKFVLFYLKEKFPDGFNYTSFQELKPYTLGVLMGGITEKVGKQNNLNIEPVPNLDQVFKKLEAKRNDFAVAVDLSGMFLIEEIFPKEKDHFTFNSTKPFVSSKGSLILNKKHPEYASQLAKLKEGLKTIYKNGTWLQILENYYGKGRVPKDSVALIEETIAK
jgi:polar amino acid transport system substrate-binding protein